MKNFLLALALSVPSVMHAQVATQVVISEIYGGGGNSGATLKNDFIELYNPTACPVSLTGWSVQYASATGSNWSVTNLAGTIGAKGFYLIQEAQGAGGTDTLPLPDAAGTIAMAATAGKVALVNTTTALSGTCPTGVQIVDFVGFGSTANCFKGAGPTPAPGNTASVERKATAASTAATLATGGTEAAAGNGYQTDSNNSNFVVQPAENPQNTSSPVEGTVSNTASAAAGISPAEPSTNGTFTVLLSTAAPAGGAAFTYTLSGTATAGTDYTDVQGGSLTIPAGSTTGTISISILNDLVAEGTETVILNLTGGSGGYALCSSNATLNLADDDIAAVFLHTLQGTGAAAATGTYTASAIVTGVYPSLNPAGFYMQEEDADADTDPNTSEGIFVVSSAAVSVGDKVQVTGTVQENAASPSFNQAVFTGATVSVVSPNNPLPAATAISLPVTAVTDFEKYEGMLVRFPAVLTVTNNYDLGRYGEVGLSAGGVVYQPTQVTDPNDAANSGTTSSGTANVSAVNALAAGNRLRTVLLDDGYDATTVLPYADTANRTLRIGSTLTNLKGIMGYAFGTFRVQPVAYELPAFNYAPRPAVPTVGTPTVKLASFNVLNYFNGNGTGGGFPTTRGAHSVAEFGRQRAKIISALSLLNADVVGLTEIENDGTGSASAIQDLVNGLNAVMGAGTYSIINDGTTVQANNTDEIRCGIIYKSSVVTPNGAVMLSAAPVFNRPPVAQTFTAQATSQSFNFIINHFKSKGCTSSTGADQDQADGQSCYNDRRKSQAGALLSFISTTVVPTSGTSRVVSVGDYNAYEQEDPLDVFRAGGYTVPGDSSLYSYQFDGQIGSLDHAVISNNLSAAVTGFAKWNINAAEPVYLDYNDAVNDGGGDLVNPFAGTYTTSAYRSSDHDPVLIGLSLPVALPVSLFAFEAAKQKSAVLIRWATAPDAAVREFVVERAAGGGIWEPLARVVAANSGAAPEYAVTDESPAAGDNLYRLKMAALNGSVSFSATQKVSFGSASTGIKIYPNPATSVLHIVPADGGGKGMRVWILNTLSQPVLTTSVLENGAVALDVSALAPGVYFVRTVLEDGTVHMQKITVTQ